MSTARPQDEVAEVIREICLVMDCCNTDLAEIRRGAAIVLVATDIGRKNWSLEIQRKFAAVPLCYPCKLTKVPIVDRGRCPLLRSPPPWCTIARDCHGQRRAGAILTTPAPRHRARLLAMTRPRCPSWTAARCSGSSLG